MSNKQTDRYNGREKINGSRIVKADLTKPKCRKLEREGKIKSKIEAN